MNNNFLTSSTIPNEKLISFKVHKKGNDILYAFSDPELIGKIFRDKTKKTKINVKAEFYEGELITLKEAIEILKNYPNSNIVGSLAYFAVKIGIAHKHSLLWIKDHEKQIRVPHLLLMRIS